MAYTLPTVVYYDPIAGAFPYERPYAITGIRSISFNRGRQNAVDDISGLVCVIEMYAPNSTTFPTASTRPRLGDKISVGLTNSMGYFAGYISDIQRTYGLPYNSVSGKAPDDFIVIRAEGYLGG